MAQEEFPSGATGATGVGSQPMATITSSTRHSRDDFDQQAQRPVDPRDEPPSYDTLFEPLALRRKYNIQPREDEGRETLPPYSSAISIQNVFLKKMELEGAVHRAPDRNWYRVLVTLQGTALQFHKCKGSTLFSGKDDGGKSHNSMASKRGTFLKSYSLQYADVGIAADYIKKRFVIRVRAEADQFLLSCNKIETFVLWLQSLFAAIDLAPPLDDREDPRDLSIPRRVRRRARVGFAHAPLDANLVREQEEIISTQFPQLADTETPANDTATNSSQGEIDTVAEEIEETESSSTPPATTAPSPLQSAAYFTIPRPNPIPSPAASDSRPSLFSRARYAIQSTTHLNLASTTPNPSVTSDGKWRPQHQWTHFYDMLYAKRCMAILTHRSPRKSNLMILMGKQWVVDWGTGKLERCSPPDYGEIDGRETAGELRVGQSGTLVRG
ncbi:hypothetical protein QTJ16_002187 [Diplocarpon rosae]|uniref:PH domain-containing protein n=1 Tax=Diplocarpon rosae TaxID=946125 RepID=A0AAD9T5G5_9HELO|nr:hypothetical protein QTJ16_002187 [Diplocarpon rosae]